MSGKRWSRDVGTHLSPSNRSGLATCPECKSRNTKYEYRDDMHKCRDCGLVFEERVLK